MYPKRSVITLSVIVLSVCFISQCITKTEERTASIKNYKGQQFTGSAVCADCHKQIYDQHIHTAHYLTSQPAIAQYIKGSFETGKNAFFYNQSVEVAMEKRDSGFYQVEYYRGIEKKAHRFDIVIGSGTMGQSYLYWRDNYLFQLPITYFTAANAWSNSPGFPDKVVFNRLITSRCLECHATYATTTSETGKEPETFAKNQIIYGVDCEKCHGPGAEHVTYQKGNLADKMGKYIVNPAKLSRQQNLDLCASCHGGRLQKLTPSFQFSAGDVLSKFYVVDTTAPNTTQIDVHANQYGLLRASKCFRNSEMTCNTCHNTHENDRGNVKLYSQKCMSCHNTEHNSFCKLANQSQEVLKANCIDCHMPLQDSKAIAVQLAGGTERIAARIRSHFISIYNNESKNKSGKQKSITSL